MEKNSKQAKEPNPTFFFMLSREDILKVLNNVSHHRNVEKEVGLSLRVVCKQKLTMVRECYTWLFAHQHSSTYWVLQVGKFLLR